MLSFVLLTASVVLGLLLSNKASLKRWPRFALEDVHRFVGLLAGGFILIHVGALLADSYLPFSRTCSSRAPRRTGRWPWPRA
jgi:methionine sulfoxide reductase heme-binding subunit